MPEVIEKWKADKAMLILQLSIGVVYLWFGVLKFFPQLSPADQLAKDTIDVLTLGLIPEQVSILCLAFWETTLGALLLLGYWNRYVFLLLLTHMICTFTPLFCFVDVSFTHAPYAFTLVGQYIVKNIIIISAALVLHADNKKRLIKKQEL